MRKISEIIVLWINKKIHTPLKQASFILLIVNNYRVYSSIIYDEIISNYKEYITLKSREKSLFILGRNNMYRLYISKSNNNSKYTSEYLKDIFNIIDDSLEKEKQYTKYLIVKNYDKYHGDKIIILFYNFKNYGTLGIEQYEKLKEKENKNEITKKLHKRR